MSIIPQAENVSTNADDKIVYQYYDRDGKPIFKAKEINKKIKTIKIYPYSANRRTDLITRRKIKEFEFVGWESLKDLPDDFVKNVKGKATFINSFAFKQLLYNIRPKLPQLEKITVGINIQTRFYDKTINLNWPDLENILKQIKKEKSYFEKNKKQLINKELSQLSKKFKRESRTIYFGELKFFLDKFETFDRVTDSDIESISHLFQLLPKSKISVTTNFIQTRDKINIAYLEDIIKEFEKNSGVIYDNEKQWQHFFATNSWIFSHIFPYEVILKQKEAYVGGKTFENKDGKIVDFLYETGFQDNFALVEIKTHNKELLKATAYRGKDVFAMSEDLSGGINQCLDQKKNFIAEFGKELKPIDPKCILVIGQKKALTSYQQKCFELLRNNQKNVDIVTFDELLQKIKGLLKVIKI